MRAVRYGMTVATAIALAGCGDPLARVERLSDVQLSETDPVREALASPEELAREGGFLGGLLRREPAREEADPVAVASAAAAQSLNELTLDPDTEAVLDAPESATPKRRGLLGVLLGSPPTVAPETRLEPSPATNLETSGAAQNPAPAEPVLTDNASDAPIVTETNVDTVVETAQPDPAPRRGVLGLFRGSRTQQDAPDPQVASLPTDSSDPVREAVQEALSDPSSDVSQEQGTAEVVPSATPVAAAKSEPKRRGLRGLFGGAAPQDPETPVELAALSPDTVVETAAPQPAPLAIPDIAEKPTPRRGLFGGARKERTVKRSGPDAQDVAYGTILPYGIIARSCDARAKPMGRRIDKVGRGKGYELYDSVPDSTTPRSFYVTGFDDGCPRQFTAALAVFGAPAMHEKLRYGRPSDAYPYSDTDTAYEKVKAAVCKVGRGKPCGSRLSELERGTVFISTYEKFTDNGRWSDILLHDGTVVAAALKTP